MRPDANAIAEPRAAPDRDVPALSLTVVHYSDAPDRCTVFPPGLSGDARMSTWISADRSAFVRLAERR